MDDRTDGDIAQGQCVAVADRRVGSALDCVADLQAQGRDDVALLTIGIEQQRDAGRAIRIVLNRRNPGRDAVFLALEVDVTQLALVPAAAMANGDTALVVAPRSPTLF